MVNMMRLSKFFHRWSVVESASEDSSNDEASVFDSSHPNSTSFSSDDISTSSPVINKKSSSVSKSNSVKSNNETTSRTLKPVAARRPVSCFVTPPLPSIQDFDYFPSENVYTPPKTTSVQLKTGNSSPGLLRKVSYKLGRANLVSSPSSKHKTKLDSQRKSAPVSPLEEQQPSTPCKMTRPNDELPSTPPLSHYELSNYSPGLLRYSRISLDSDAVSMVSAKSQFHTPSSSFETFSNTSSTSYTPLAIPAKTPLSSEFPSPEDYNSSVETSSPVIPDPSPASDRLLKIANSNDGVLNREDGILFSKLPKLPLYEKTELQNIDKVLMKKSGTSKTKFQPLASSSNLPKLNKSENLLKLKIYIGRRNDDIISLQLRKDRLLNISELLDVIIFKMLDRVNNHKYHLHSNLPNVTSDDLQISIVFKESSLHPILLKDYGRRKTSGFSYSQKDLLLDYVMAKEKLYIRVDY